MTSHCHKWGPFPPNEVGRIAQHVRKGEIRKAGKMGKERIYLSGVFLNVGFFLKEYMIWRGYNAYNIMIL